MQSEETVARAASAPEPLYLWLEWAGVFVLLATVLIVTGWFFFGREKQYTRVQIRIRGDPSCL